LASIGLTFLTGKQDEDGNDDWGDEYNDAMNSDGDREEE
jgi:hypothetical protein